MSQSPSRSGPREILVGDLAIGADAPLVFIAGPCVIESRDLVLSCAERLAEIASRLGVSLIFKASYDKANRTSVSGFRGVGIEEGLAILSEVRERFGLAILTDVHTAQEVERAAGVVDVLQIPAFLCRQTDLLLAAGKSGRTVNVKKGQFMAPWDMTAAVEKVLSTGNPNVMVTERGTTFGYNRLINDMRAIPLMQEHGMVVVFDATHSVQEPSALGGASGGQRRFVGVLARAAVAAGTDAVFMEVHPDPDKAPCDGPTMWPLAALADLIEELLAVRSALTARPAPAERRPREG